MAETLKIAIDGEQVDALLAAPATPGRHPAILVAHHQEGLSPFTRDLTEKLSARGYIAICPDHYHRFTAADSLEVRRNGLRDSEILQELNAALDVLKSHPNVDPDRIAVIGHCMGGRAALLAASTLAGLKAAVIFYPTAVLVKREGNLSAFDLLQRIACPVVTFFGETDWLIPLADAAKIEAELRRCDVPLEVYRYAGAGHAFCNFSSANDFRPEAAADSWQKAIAFLDRYL